MKPSWIACFIVYVWNARCFTVPSGCGSGSPKISRVLFFGVAVKAK